MQSIVSVALAIAAIATMVVSISSLWKYSDVLKRSDSVFAIMVTFVSLGIAAMAILSIFSAQQILVYLLAALIVQLAVGIVVYWMLRRYAA